jgi:stage III sporulation protein AG
MMNSTKSSMLSYLKKQKSTLIIVVLLILGLILLILPSGTNSEKTKIDDETRLTEYAEKIENKIEKMCEKVKGVSSVNITVYFDSGFETVYAYNEESKSSSSGINSEKKYVTVGSGNDESMVTIVEKMPSICGIAIVCKGGGNPSVANELINLVSSAFGVAKNKIYVAEGKK